MTSGGNPDDPEALNLFLPGRVAMSSEGHRLSARSRCAMSQSMEIESVLNEQEIFHLISLSYYKTEY